MDIREEENLKPPNARIFRNHPLIHNGEKFTKFDCTLELWLPQIATNKNGSLQHFNSTSSTLHTIRRVGSLKGTVSLNWFITLDKVLPIDYHVLRPHSGAGDGNDLDLRDPYQNDAPFLLRLLTRVAKRILRPRVFERWAGAS